MTSIHAEPVVMPYPVSGPDDSAAVASARLAGFTAVGDTFEDQIEIRDVKEQLVRTITRAEIESLVPWMQLSTGPDGPCGLAWTDSGRRLFILIYDASPASDGNPSDAILLYDRYEDAVVLYARLELSSDESDWPHLAAAHFAGVLYVTDDAGNLFTIPAQRNQASASIASSVSSPDTSKITGLAIDQQGGFLFAASQSAIYRADLSTQPLDLQFVALVSSTRAIAWSSHFGGPGNDGLYVLMGQTPGASTLLAITPDQARGDMFFQPAVYLNIPSLQHDIAATSVGSLILGSDEDAQEITDDTDPRLTFDGWIADEFAQVVLFAKGLIAPDGEPSGWVIDADVLPGASRFHPATPDGANWVILLLMTNDHLFGDPEAQGLVRDILQRYAGLAPSGPGADRSSDGYFTHWIDPNTGMTKAGWPDEFAVYSTMKLVAAAIRAARLYPNDPEIQAAAQAIVCGVSDWDSYIDPQTDDVYLKSLPAGGPDLSVRNAPFTEGILFVEQASAFGSASSQLAFSRWIDRDLWPTATYVFGRPVTGATSTVFQPGFITGYPFLLLSQFRADPRWMLHAQNLLISHAAWTDDTGPKFWTMFSAGTTKPIWGGYHADSLSDHPGDVASFPALMALSGTGDLEPAAAAYEAYRMGARTTFKTGASILYRRSAIDPAYTPDSAGLPDVALGALGLAELISPGAVDAVLAVDSPAGFCSTPPVCLPDVNADGQLTPADFTAWIAAFNAGDLRADQNSDGLISPADFTSWIANFNAGC